MSDVRRTNVKLIAQGLGVMAGLQQAGADYLPKELANNFDRTDLTAACFGAVAELVEVADAAGWKPWRRPQELDEDGLAHLAEEVGDLLHFLAWIMRNLKVTHGLTLEMVAEGYMRAHEKNIARFQGKVPGREPPPAGPDGGIIYINRAYRNATTAVPMPPATFNIAAEAGLDAAFTAMQVDLENGVVKVDGYVAAADPAPDGSGFAYSPEDLHRAD